MKEDNNMLQYFSKEFILYIFHVTYTYIICSIFETANIITFFQRDMLPIFNVQLIGVILYMLFLYLLINIEDEKWIVDCKNNRSKYKVFIMLFVFAVFAKKLSPRTTWYYVVLLGFINLLVEYTSTYEYKECEDKEYTDPFLNDKPVLKTDFTAAQRRAYDKIVEILDKADRNSAINIALLGAWGNGKTGVIDEVIRGIQNKENNSAYFVLKINTLTFAKVENLVEYVNQYFSMLFRKYGVSGLNRSVELEYFNTLIEVLGEQKLGFLNSFINNKSSFCHLERERKLFHNSIQTLLANSKRKNMLLVIDDADRTDMMEEIIRLLYEFSSVEGIVTVILLDDDRFNQHSGNNVYSAYDKFIHFTVSIDEEDDIEYEDTLRNLLYKAYTRSGIKNQDRYIYLKKWDIAMTFL